MSDVGLALAAVATLSAGMGVLGMRRRRLPVARPYLAFTTGIFLWTVAYIWEIEADSFAVMVLAAKVQYLAIATVPVAAFWFATLYTGRGRWWTEVRRFAFIVPVITVVLVWTNEWHGLIWRDLQVLEGGDWSVLVVSYGSYFWAHVAYSYLCLLTGLALSLELAFRTSGLWFRQTVLILSGMLAPWVGNFLRISGLSPFGPFDPTVFAFSVSVVVFGLAALDVRLFSLAPVARDMVLDLIDEGIVVLDDQRRVVELNRAAARILDVDFGASLGADGRDLLGPLAEVLDVPGYSPTLRIARDGGASYVDCARVDAALGKAARMPVGVLLRDVTDIETASRALVAAHTLLEERVEERTQKLAEAYAQLADEAAARVEVQEQLLHAQRLDTIGTYVGGIAHDFNNLLAAILGFSEMLLLDAPDDDPAKEDLEQILLAAERGRGLVRQILRFSRPAESKRAPLCLESSIAEAVDMVRAIVPATVSIERFSEPDLPRVVADAGQVQQVLTNLCVNAAHAMPDGGVLGISLRAAPLPQALATSVSASPDLAGWLRLDVADTGCGMDEETRNRVFDPFFTTKLSGKGTGLGLSVAQDIVTGHGGTITVDSAPGRGTTFSVYLPVPEGRQQGSDRSSLVSSAAQGAHL